MNIIMWPGTINTADPSVGAVLRRGSAAARLLRLWVRIPHGHGRLSDVCCQEEASATGWSLVQRNPTECGVSECDCESTIMRPWPTASWCAMVKKKSIPVSKGLSIKQYSLFGQLSNMFRPKLGQVQALKIQNTMRETFNGQGGYYHYNSGFCGR